MHIIYFKKIPNISRLYEPTSGGITGRIRDINSVSDVDRGCGRAAGRGHDGDRQGRAQAANGTDEVTSNIAGVAQSSEETGAAARHVLQAESELSRQSEHLRAEVTRFLATVRAA